MSTPYMPIVPTRSPPKPPTLLSPYASQTFLTVPSSSGRTLISASSDLIWVARGDCLYLYSVKSFDPAKSSSSSSSSVVVCGGSRANSDVKQTRKYKFRCLIVRVIVRSTTDTAYVLLSNGDGCIVTGKGAKSVMKTWKYSDVNVSITSACFNGDETGIEGIDGFGNVWEHRLDEGVSEMKVKERNDREGRYIIKRASPLDSNLICDSTSFKVTRGGKWTVPNAITKSNRSGASISDDATAISSTSQILIPVSNVVEIYTLCANPVPIRTLQAHASLVTSLDACVLDGVECVATTSADGALKVWTLCEYDVDVCLRYGQPVSSVRFLGGSASSSEDSKAYVVTTIDGCITCKSRSAFTDSQRGERKKIRNDKLRKRGGTYKYFRREGDAVLQASSEEGGGDKPGYNVVPSSTTGGGSNFKVSVSGKKQKLSAYDASIKSFRYSHALDSALSTHDPRVITSCISEISSRSGLRASLASRTPSEFDNIVSFLCRYVGNPSHGPSLIPACAALVDAYQDDDNVMVREGFFKLRNAVRDAVKVNRGFAELEAIADFTIG